MGTDLTPRPALVSMYRQTQDRRYYWQNPRARWCPFVLPQRSWAIGSRGYRQSRQQELWRRPEPESSTGRLMMSLSPRPAPKPVPPPVGCSRREELRPLFRLRAVERPRLVRELTPGLIPSRASDVSSRLADRRRADTADRGPFRAPCGGWNRISRWSSPRERATGPWPSRTTPHRRRTNQYGHPILVHVPVPETYTQPYRLWSRDW